MTTKGMDGFDAVMWGLETDPRLRSHAVAAIVLDGPTDETALRRRMSEIAAGNPRMRSRVLPPPRPLATDRWQEIPDFDGADHVGSITAAAAQAQGSLAEVLNDIVAEAVDQPYDISRPLWGVTLVNDLPDGASAIVARLHHCLTDGVGGMMMAAQFFDADSEGTRLMEPESPAVDAGAAHQGPAPEADTRTDMIAESVLEDLASATSLGTRLWSAVRAVPGRVAEGAGQPGTSTIQAAQYAASLARLLAPASEPLSPLLTGHSARSVVGTLDYPVADLKAAGRPYGARLNDVYLAALAIGLRSYHEALGVQPVDAVRVNMPVNYRPTDSAATGGNMFTPVRVLLPLTGSTPAETLALVGECVQQGRNEPALGVTAAITEILGRLPSAVTERLVTGMFHGIDVSATNVPGPPVPLWFAGRRVKTMYVAAPRSGGALCTALLSYDGTAHLAVNMDVGAIAEPDTFMACLDAGFQELLALAQD